MCMNINIVEKLNEIINTLSGHFKYVRLGGSKTFPFIKNPQDYDIIIVCENDEDRMQCLKMYRGSFNPKTLRETYGFDVHIETVAYEYKYLYARLYSQEFLANDVIYEALKPVVPDTITVEYFLSKKNDIMVFYKDFTDKMKKRVTDDKIPHMIKDKYAYKFWYNIYLNLCVFNNKSIELTDEQIENINILHDRKEEDLEKRTKLIDDIIKEIDQWKI